MNILGGVVPPSAGQMLLDGVAFEPQDPGEADKAGIAFIHQELNLFTNLSIAENFFISDFPTMGRVPLLNRRDLNKRARDFLALVDLAVSPGRAGRALGPRRASAGRGRQGAVEGRRHHHLRRAHHVAHGT